MKDAVTDMSTASPDQLKQRIRSIPDFPKPGILFYDITTLLQDPDGFRDTIAVMTSPFEGRGITHVIGIESRGFILGAALASTLGAGFIPIRKPGKLPSVTVRETYALEYGTDTLEMHSDALGAQHRVLIVDDVLATGGTARAAVNLVKQVGGTLHGLAFLVELTFLPGRAKLEGEHVFAALAY